VKFALGYQLPEEGEDPFVEIVRDHREHIEEVYFPWLDMPSGRSPMTSQNGIVDWQGQQQLEADLRALRKMGVKLDLLLNASCYGRLGFSRYLANYVCSIIAHLQDLVALDAVTTMSPMIASAVKHHFPKVDVRASVNMRLGTVKALQYVAHIFDSFCMQREFNRDLARVAALKAWCDAHGKRLHMLANSGCLNFCSVQAFHDNLVAHETEVSETINVEERSPAMCWAFYGDRANWVSFLQNSWVRPEDVSNYAPYFSVMKLATRMHANPRRVIEAYARGRFAGNLPDLLEPGHGPVFAPYVIDNSKFPSDWFARTTRCNKKCHECAYCSAVLKQVLVRFDSVFCAWAGRTAGLKAGRLARPMRKKQ
jgi:collagenase-like PrtC family protease